MTKKEESEPLLPLHAPSNYPAQAAPPLSTLSSTLPLPNTSSSSSSSSAFPQGRTRLNARRTSSTLPSSSPLSEKSKGKQPATEDPTSTSTSTSDEIISKRKQEGHKGQKASKGEQVGRHVTVIFSGDDGGSETNLELWVEDGESVGSVKDQIRHLRPTMRDKSLRMIHSGRLLTDGILLLPWLRTLEERVKRQTGGVGADVESVLKDVGLGEDDDEEGEGEAGQAGGRARRGGGGGGSGRSEGKRKDGGESGGGGRVWLHCVVGGKVEEKEEVKEDEPAAPRRRGFDVLLDAGLSAADVAAMRRQFYESRGEEVPEDMGEANDEHARALEEQWIEGDMTAETATTTTEGMFTSTLNGLLAGFLFPIIPWFFFRELPLPNFFDADAEALGDDPGRVSERVAESVGGEILPSVVFGKRMQMGILFGTILNLAFGALRFLN